MGSISNFLEDKWLDHLFNAAWTPPAALFVALCTADPLDTATGASMSEVANANAYQRTAITFGAAATRKVIQSGAVTFPQATGAWGTITHWALVSSQTYGAGDVLASGDFTASFAPVNGNTPTIPDTEIEVEILATAAGAGFTDYTVHSMLNKAFRNITFTKPSTYIGLCTAVLSDTSVTAPGSEVAGGNYARKQVNVNGGASPTWSLSSGGHVDNVQAITFNTPSGSWGQITSCFIIDSPTGAGNVLGYDNANIVDQTPVANDTVQFAALAFDVTIS